MTGISAARVIVTGAGKGIGREISSHLTELGAKVIAVSRSAVDLVSLREQIGCETITADLADAEHARMLVNNAGISIPQPAMQTTIDAFDRTIAINVRAAMIFSQIFAGNLIRRGKGGAIVNVSSQASKVALADHLAYCASKGALDQLTRVLALELGPHNIRVNSVNPTVTLTPMGKMAWGDPAKSGPMLAKIPLGKFADPIDVAHAVAFLLSDQSRMITGVTLPVDGGFLAT